MNKENNEQIKHDFEGKVELLLDALKIVLIDSVDKIYANGGTSEDVGILGDVINSKITNMMEEVL